MSGGPTKCGFVAVLGLPNSGKSTLVNALVGSKVSIVTHKAQTTRQRILGIITQGDTQMILIDTPGIFKPKKTMERAMVKAAWDALSDADAVLHLVDATINDALVRNKVIMERLPKDVPCLLALNKIDKSKREEFMPLVASFNAAFGYTATFMISALKANGLDKILQEAAALMPKAPWMYGEDEITDVPMRLMAAEITREQIFRQLHEELPYSITVETESWETFDNGSVKISQIIYVERDSQKGIVLGRGGAQIKKIGEYARKDIEALFEMRCHLKLLVKVKDGALTQVTDLGEYGLS